MPSRIVIIGPSGSGKSTLARAIGARLGLPVVHLDMLFWNPGWTPSPLEVFRERVGAAAAEPSWVMDGNYTACLDTRLARAQAVVWLDLPRWIYFPRTVRRLARYYGRERGDLGAGCRERFDLAFFRDWVWAYPARRRSDHAALVAALPDGVTAVVLRSPREVRQFVTALPHSLGPLT